MVFGIGAGAYKTRNGNMYDAATGARLTALNPVGAPTPEMEVFKFATYDALVKAQANYPGYVTAIMLSGTHVEPWMGSKERDSNEATDYFVEQADGSFVRSDKWGKVNADLESLTPNHGGALATGNVGPESATEAQPEPTVPGVGGGTAGAIELDFAGNEGDRTRPSGPLSFTAGQPITFHGRAPGLARSGYFSIVPTGGETAGFLRVDVRVNDVALPPFREVSPNVTFAINLNNGSYVHLATDDEITITVTPDGSGTGNLHFNPNA